MTKAAFERSRVLGPLDGATARSPGENREGRGMVKSEKELLKELRAKDQELRAFVSKSLGLRDLVNLDENQREQIEEELGT